MGDSHVKRMARTVQNIAKEDIETFGIAKPGAGFEDVIEDLHNIAAELTPRDHLVIMGGTNDVERILANRDKTPFSQENIDAIVSYARTTKVSIVSIPNRWDKPSLNRTINSVNKDLKAKIKMAEKKLDDDEVTERVNFIEINKCVSKQHYHTDNLHLNQMGKNVLAVAIMQSFDEDN